MALSDDLTAIQSDLTTLSDAVGKAVTDLGATDPSDAIVAAVVAALTDAGYTVTAPVAPATEAEIPATT